MYVQDVIQNDIIWNNKWIIRLWRFNCANIWYDWVKSESVYTFCTLEATDAILKWLELRLQIGSQNGVGLKIGDSLEDMSTRQITYHFSNIMMHCV